jgi:DNA-directed RNA polymerase specialized sigma24 family protein
VGEATTVPRGRSRGGRFEDLYMAYGAEALRLAYLMTGDRILAEDVAQEAFVRLLKRFNDETFGATISSPPPASPASSAGFLGRSRALLSAIR